MEFAWGANKRYTDGVRWRHRIGAGLLTAVYLATNVTGLYSAETNFWKDRRTAARHQSKNHQLAQLPLVIPRSMPSGELFSPIEPKPIENRVSILHRSMPLGAQEKLGWLPGLVAPFGDLGEVYLSKNPSAPLVIHLQDAHESLEAQRGQAGIIEALGKRGLSAVVGLEGASGPFSLEDYRASPNHEINRGVADLLMRLGYIGGAEFAGISAQTPPLLWGIETKGLYTRNLSAFSESEKNRAPLTQAVLSLKSFSDQAAELLYSPELRKFDVAVSSYRDGNKSLGDHVEYLWNSFKGPAGMFPNLSGLRKALEMEKTMDFNKVETERRSLVDLLAHRLGPSDLKSIVDQSMAYRLGRISSSEYHAYLRTMSERNGIHLDAFGSVERYMKYLALAEGIDRGTLLSELSSMERAVEAQWAVSPEEKMLTHCRRNLILLQHLANHAFTPEEWGTYVAVRKDMPKIPEILAGLTGRPAPPESSFLTSTSLQSFEDFSSAAIERNNSLVDNLLDKVKAEKASVSVLVAGGFHTPGMTQLLKKADISFAVVTPRMSEIPKDTRPLQFLVRAPLPLEKLLTGEAIHLQSPRLTASHLLPVPSVWDKPLQIKAQTVKLIPRLVSPLLELLVGGKTSSNARILKSSVKSNSDGDSVARVTVERQGALQRGARSFVSAVAAYREAVEKNPTLMGQEEASVPPFNITLNRREILVQFSSPPLRRQTILTDLSKINDRLNRLLAYDFNGLLLLIALWYIFLPNVSWAGEILGSSFGLQGNGGNLFDLLRETLAFMVFGVTSDKGKKGFSEPDINPSVSGNSPKSPDMVQGQETTGQPWQKIKFHPTSRSKKGTQSPLIPSSSLPRPESYVAELENNLHLEYGGAYTPAKWLASGEVFQRVKTGDFDGISPVTVQIVPSLACNYKCATCSYGKNKDEIREHLVPKEDLLMSLDNMKKYIDDLVRNKVKGIVFTGGGEPLLNPHTIEGIRYAKSQGLDVGLFTNGSYLNEDKIKKLLQSGLSFLRVSLNAGTPRIHQLFHGLTSDDAFHRVIANLETLARVKSEWGPTCTTGIDVGVIISPLNVYDLTEVAKQIKRIDDLYPRMLGNLAYRPTVNYVASKIEHGDSISRTLEFLKKSKPHQKFYEESARYFQNGEQFSPGLFQEALRELEKVKEILKDNIQNGTLSVVIPTARIKGTSSVARPFSRCLASPLVVFVVPKGDVYGCVELAMNDELLLGNMNQMLFSELWVSEKRKQVMSFLKQTCVATMCPPVCMLYEYNRMFHIIAGALDAGGEEAKAMQQKLDELHQTLGRTLKGVSFMFPALLRLMGFEEQTPDIRLKVLFNQSGQVRLEKDLGSEASLGNEEEAMLIRSLGTWATALPQGPPARVDLRITYNMEATAQFTGERIEINRALLRAPAQGADAAQQLLHVVVWHEGYHLLNPQHTETQATLATANFLKEHEELLDGFLKGLHDRDSLILPGRHFAPLQRMLDERSEKLFKMALSINDEPPSLSHPVRWGRGSDHPGKAVVVGDADADLTAVRQIFLAEKLVNEKDHWIGGRQVAVQVGDVIGRGNKPKELYEYLFAVQAEARRAGGDVILLLGNHEMALLMGEPIGGDFKEEETELREKMRHLLRDGVLDGRLQGAAVLEGADRAKHLVTHAGYSEKLKDFLSGIPVWDDWLENFREGEIFNEEMDLRINERALLQFINHSVRSIAEHVRDFPNKPPRTSGDLRQWLNRSNGILMGPEGFMNRVASFIDDQLVPMPQVFGHTVGSTVRFQDKQRLAINTDSGLHRPDRKYVSRPRYLRFTSEGSPQTVEVGRFGERRVSRLGSGYDQSIPSNLWAWIIEIKDRITLRVHPLEWLRLHVDHANSLEELVAAYQRFYDVLGRGEWPWVRRHRPVLWAESQRLLVQQLWDQRAPWAMAPMGDGDDRWGVIQGNEDRMDDLLRRAQEVWNDLPDRKKGEFLPAFLASRRYHAPPIPSEQKSQLDLELLNSPVAISVRETGFAGVHEILIEAAPDRVGLLADMAGIIAAHGFHVLAGDVRAPDGAVLGRFFVSGLAEESDKRKEQRDQMEKDFLDLVTGSSTIEDLFSRQGRPYRFAMSERPGSPPSVVGFHNGNLSILTPDRTEPGLLHLIARKLSELGCNIALAPESIHTQGDTVYDFFNVTGADGKTPLTPQQKIKVAKDLALMLNSRVITQDNFSMNRDAFDPWLHSEGPNAVAFSALEELNRELLGGPAHSMKMGNLTADVDRARRAFDEERSRAKASRVSLEQVLGTWDLRGKDGQMSEAAVLRAGKALAKKFQLAAFFRPQGQNFFVQPTVDGGPEPTGESRLGQVVREDKEFMEDPVPLARRLVFAALLSLGEVIGTGTPENWNRWASLLARGFNDKLFDAEEVVTTSLQENRPQVFVLSETLLSGEPTPQDKTHLAELEVLARQATLLHDRQISWVLPNPSASLETLWERYPTLSPLRNIKAAEWDQSDFLGEDGNYSVKKLLLSVQGVSQVNDLRPTDIFLMNRNGWVVEEDLSNDVVRLLISLVGGLVYDVTTPMGEEINQLYYLRINA